MDHGRGDQYHFGNEAKTETPKTVVQLFLALRPRASSDLPTTNVQRLRTCDRVGNFHKV